jgi:hypothetical protein
MRRSRNPHFRVDDLSETARRIVRDGLDRNERESVIRQRIFEATGEKIAASSLNRYAGWYRQRMRERQVIRERVEVAVETSARMGQQMSAGVQAELMDVLYTAAHEGTLGEIGPFFAGRLALAFGEAERKDAELKLKQQELQLKAQATKLAEEKWKAAQEAAAKADAEAAALEQKAQSGDKVTADDIARLRAAYGLKPRTEAEAPSAA